MLSQIILRAIAVIAAIRPYDKENTQRNVDCYVDCSVFLNEMAYFVM
jgi:hypothetical protein